MAKHLQFGQQSANTVSAMTVILVLVMFGCFLAVDWFFGNPVVATEPDVRLFDHTGDQFAAIGVTMADGGKPLCTCPVVATELDIRLFDHTGDQFTTLGVTMADGGKPICRCPQCGSTFNLLTFLEGVSSAISSAAR